MVKVEFAAACVLEVSLPSEHWFLIWLKFAINNVKSDTGSNNKQYIENEQTNDCFLGREIGLPLQVILSELKQLNIGQFQMVFSMDVLVHHGVWLLCFDADFLDKANQIIPYKEMKEACTPNSDKRTVQNLIQTMNSKNVS